DGADLVFGANPLNHAHVADVADDHGDRRGQRRRLAAREVVEDHYIAAGVDGHAREVAADESGPAGNEDRAPVSHLWRFTRLTKCKRGTAGARPRAAASRVRGSSRAR